MDKHTKISQLDILSIAQELYDDIWERKTKAALARKTGKNSNTTGGMHHAPTVNKKGSKDALKGVLYCGGLLPRHLLVIGATLGIFPVHFGTYREIANTHSRTCLSKQFGLFKKEDTIASKTSMYGENMCCNAVQASISKTHTRWKDSFYVNQRRLVSINMVDSTPERTEAKAIQKKQQSTGGVGNVKYAAFDPAKLLLCNAEYCHHLNLKCMAMEYLGHTRIMTFNDIAMKKNK
eukprot:8903092-Ditylum_brightwellii.AAC.1